MPWAKVDDGWWSHPKVLGLSLAARGLWVTALSWSCAQRRDEVPRQLAVMVAEDPDELAGELVAAGLWQVTDRGWRIHDWAQYQDRSISEKRAEAGRKGGLRSGQSRSKSEPTSKQTKQDPGSKREANTEAGAQPVPTQPNPAAADGYAEFHTARAAAEVKRRQSEGLNVKNAGGLRRSVAADPEFIAESERLWAHRDHDPCKGTGFTEHYAPGSGTRKVECQEDPSG